MRFQNAEKLLKNYIKQAEWNYTKTKPPQGLAPYTAVKMNPYLLDKVQVHYNKNRRQGSAGRKMDGQNGIEPYAATHNPAALHVYCPMIGHGAWIRTRILAIPEIKRAPAVDQLQNPANGGR